MTSRERIETEYAAAHTHAIQLTERIQQMLQDTPAPDGLTTIGWDDVGTLRHTCIRLQELLETNAPEDDVS